MLRHALVAHLISVHRSLLKTPSCSTTSYLSTLGTTHCFAVPPNTLFFYHPSFDYCRRYAVSPSILQDGGLLPATRLRRL